MGRHSAQDEVDDDAVEIDSPLAVLDLGAGRGRHASADDQAEDDSDVGAPDPDEVGFDQALTERIAVVEADPAVVDAASSVPPPAPPYVDTTVETKVDTKVDKKSGKASAKAAKQADRQAEKSAEAQRKADRKAARKAQRGESDTKADLRVLREQPAVRAQVIGAVIASFLIYTLVLLALGRTDKYLFWLWVPIVTCGVLVGVVLDLAHRRARKRGRSSG